MSPVCHQAPTCREALAEATLLWPKRRRTSDGTCAGAAHHAQNPGSDHEPNILIDGLYYESAFDLSDDPANGCDAFALMEMLRLKQDIRIKYVICDRMMYSSYSGTGITAWEWRPYTGADPHNTHAHVSVLPDHLFDTGLWWRPLVEDDDMTDGTRRRLIREWYITYLHREPTVQEQNIWGGFWYTKGDNGEDLTLAGIYDSPEAVAYRQKHGK